MSNLRIGRRCERTSVCGHTVRSADQTIHGCATMLFEALKAMLRLLAKVSPRRFAVAHLLSSVSTSQAHALHTQGTGEGNACCYPLAGLLSPIQHPLVKYPRFRCLQDVLR